MLQRSIILTVLALIVIASLSAAAGSATPAPTSTKSVDSDRLQNAGTVLKEILDNPNYISQDLLDRAKCVIVFPSVTKAEFKGGDGYGRGAMTCRSGEDFKGPWDAPTMMALESGSLGRQLGGYSTDFVLLVMKDSCANAILSGRVNLGGDVSAAAGLIGPNPMTGTDVTMRAEILTYSRVRGLFAGLSLEGATLRPDNDSNERIYKKKIEAKDITLKGVEPVPPAARQLVDTLSQHSPPRPVREVAQSASVELKEGQTPEEVEQILGKPEDVITVKETVIYIYSTVRIFFDNGKLVNVEERKR